MSSYREKSDKNYGLKSITKTKNENVEEDVESITADTIRKRIVAEVPKSLTDQRKELRLKNLEIARLRLKELNDERKKKAMEDAKKEEKAIKEAERVKKTEIEKEKIINRVRDIKLVRGADESDIVEVDDDVEEVVKNHSVRRPVVVDDADMPVAPKAPRMMPVPTTAPKKKGSVMKVVKIKYYTNNGDEDEIERGVIRGDDLETLAKIHKKEAPPPPPQNNYNNLFNY